MKGDFFITSHSEEISTFLDLQDKTFVVTCSYHNPENAEKQYFGCKDRYSSLGVGCNFFV